MESIQSPLHFSLFHCGHLLKSEKFILFLINVTQHPILTEKYRNVEMFANLLKKKN